MTPRVGAGGGKADLDPPLLILLMFLYLITKSNPK